MVKKMLRIIGSMILVIIVLLAIILIKGALTPAAPNNYTKTTETGGEIERKYLANGSYETAYFEQKVDEDYKKFEIYYPKELKTSTKTYPVLVVLNGTGVKASKYKAVFKHYASYGFVAIGTEEESAWDGIAGDQSLAFLLEQNENTDSIFYHKLDLDNIGVVGHSQGGVGVFSTITNTRHANLYKTAVALSPTSEELADALGWHYDLRKINVPILIFAGTEGDFEMDTVIPLEALPEIYGKIQSPKAMARKKDCEHGDMLYSADGYVTAWFMWQLQGDVEAGKAFVGEQAELLGNALYQYQEIDLQ